MLKVIYLRSYKARRQAMTAKFEIGWAFIFAMVLVRLRYMLSSKLNGT